MQHSQLSDGRDRFNRRAFCKAGVATTVGVVGVNLLSLLAHADLTKEQRNKMTADEIIQQMKAGNERFRSGKPQHRDLMQEAKATAKGQSCRDCLEPISEYVAEAQLSWKTITDNHRSANPSLEPTVSLVVNAGSLEFTVD